MHVAQSLDGRIALAGMPTALSTPEGRRSAHEARAANDAVLVGANTVRIDDPQLTLRDVPGSQPLRVVLASTLELPPGSKILGTDGRAVIIGARGRVHEDARRTIEAAGASALVTAATSEGEVDIAAALAALHERGVKRLLVEGGARILTSFFRARAVDRIRIEMSMRLLGAPGTPMLGAIGVAALRDTPTLKNIEVERLGINVLVRGDLVWS
ncbi:Diaminohydroxyphosphoribosylaminopyrimidine deaminase [Labilithrix luteola]|uniref:Diaminohydroxyphosphoribosylaminopyrimidine deaminase n=1 Tax=Labilithrix luteola TaxID=1391654 RepID=A0A0K1PSJ1_9BACT|nr:Diaminohydroxyphosphoribosylaminopyrimidine deaminase [Labilithrix luteola]